MNADEMLDRALLNFETSDFGIAAARGTPESDRAQAEDECVRVLDEAVRRWTDEPDLAFWRRWVRSIWFGEGIDLAEVRRLAAASSRLDPHLYIYLETEGRESAAEARALLESCRGGETARERYIVAVLGGRVPRHGGGGG